MNCQCYRITYPFSSQNFVGAVDGSGILEKLTKNSKAIWFLQSELLKNMYAITTILWSQVVGWSNGKSKWFLRFFYYTYNYMYIHKCHLFKYFLRDWLAHAQCYVSCIYKLLLLQRVLIGNLLLFIACQGIGPKFRVKTVNEPKIKKGKNNLHKYKKIIL